MYFNCFTVMCHPNKKALPYETLCMTNYTVSMCCVQIEFWLSSAGRVDKNTSRIKIQQKKKTVSQQP